MQKRNAIELYVDRSEESLIFLLRLRKRYELRLEADLYDDEINHISDYNHAEGTRSRVIEIEFFEVPKGIIKEEVEKTCKELGFIRLIDAWEFLFLLKRNWKFFYDHGDPNQISFPMIGSVRTQWQNKDEEWYFMDFELCKLKIDRIWIEDGIKDEYEVWNFIGVRSVNSR